MKQEYIEAFLEIAKTRNVTKASENLHLAQSTVSNYIKCMEDELGMTLLFRSRGLRNVELTSYGEQFMPIAESWMNLIIQAEALKKDMPMMLNLGSTDSLNDSILYPVLDKITKDYENIYITVRTSSSNTIYQMADNREIDVGLAGFDAYRPNVVSELAFSEKMCVVRNITDEVSKKLYHPKDFKEKNEIMLRWGTDFAVWHGEHWNDSVRPALETDSMVLLRRYINSPNHWSVMPKVELGYFERKNLQICDLGQYNPPNRNIYILKPKHLHANHRVAADIFYSYLREYVENNPDLIIRNR